MMWPFKRKRKQPKQPSTDWRPGDIAECVCRLWDGKEGRISAIEVGSRHMVLHVFFGPRMIDGVLAYGLEFVGRPATYEACAFRKITDVGVEEPRRLVKPVCEDA